MNSSLDPMVNSKCKVEKRPHAVSNPSSQEPPRRRSKDHEKPLDSKPNVNSVSPIITQTPPVFISPNPSQDSSWRQSDLYYEYCHNEFASPGLTFSPLEPPRLSQDVNFSNCEDYPPLYPPYLSQAGDERAAHEFNMNDYIQFSQVGSQGKAQEILSQNSRPEGGVKASQEKGDYKTDENYKKAENFSVYVMNDEAKTNHDTYFDHENNILYTRKDVKVKFQVGLYTPDFLPYLVRLTITADQSHSFNGKPCKEHQDRVHYAFPTSGFIIEAGKRVIMDMPYPLADKPHMEVTFSCHNSCFKTTKKFFDMLFELHDNTDRVFQQVRMRLKVCAVPSRDAKLTTRNPARDIEFNTALNQLSSDPKIIFAPFFGVDKFRRVVQMVSDSEIRDRHIISNQNQHLLHNSQISKDTEIRVWLSRFQMDHYTKVFLDNRIRTMKQLCWEFHKDQEVFTKLKIPAQCALGMSKSFVNWLYATLQEDELFFNEYIARLAVVPT